MSGMADEQTDETTPQIVDRLLYTLGEDTDFDNYTFLIRRGNLRRLLAALRQPAPDAGDMQGLVEREYIAMLKDEKP